MISLSDDALAAIIEDRGLAAAMRAGIDAFPRYRALIPLLAGGYTRTQLRNTAEFELVAMQWAANSASPIHDHGASRCWIVMLEGALDVESFDRLDDGSTSHAFIESRSRAVIKTGNLDHRMSWRELHRVKNLTDASAYSLQLYAGPQSEYAIVDGTTYECSRAKPVHDTTLRI
ncbi:MAG: cysteine dioxygenase family protein [Candidatus Eremiobacteraeota bacterium]|nr:cysteine dioxygenase family protein [Candidatus Eremiobacteraeota bacterium]